MKREVKKKMFKTLKKNFIEHRTKEVKIKKEAN